MGKFLVVSSLILISFLFCGDIYAEAPVKAAILYNLDSNSAEEAVGSTIIPDLFEIENLDYDLLIASETGETLDNDNKTIINGISYNYDISEKWSVGAGVALGLKRFERFSSHRLGEIDKYIYGAVTHNF